MRVHWTSSISDPGSVRFGRVGDDGGPMVAAEDPGTPHTYEAAAMCEAPVTDAFAFVDPGWLHEAVLTGLEI